jgi:cytochrome P450
MTAPPHEETPNLWKRANIKVGQSVKRLLWAGGHGNQILADPELLDTYPLPPGSLGCPFALPGGLLQRGNKADPRKASPEFGPGLFFQETSTHLGHPRAFKFLPKTPWGTPPRPVVVVSGYQNTKQLLGYEFGSGLVSNDKPWTSKIIGKNSLRFSRKKREHSTLRQLVGAGMANAALEDAVPFLQEAAENVLIPFITDNIQGSTHGSNNSNNSTITMDQLCREFTLDVVWKQIVGLDLASQEIPAFRRAVNDWLAGLMATTDEERQDSQAARQYLVDRIDEKLASLKQRGSPDGSTLGGMYFATSDDEEGGDAPRHLSHDEIIDNTLLLILAGTETSVGVLTLTTFLLGLHPKWWDKLQREQQACMDKQDQKNDGHNKQLTRAQLDTKGIAEGDVPLLDAVLREALRIRPIVGGSLRGVQTTLKVSDYQIPKGWLATYDRRLTHELDPTTFEADGSHMDVVEGFRPERWLTPETRPSREFIPFGVGARYCLGADLAMLEMKVFMAVLLRQSISKEVNLTLVDPNPHHSSDSIRWKTNVLVPIPESGVSVQFDKYSNSKGE